MDKAGHTIDFVLRARRFFGKAIAARDTLKTVTVDKSGANLAGAQAVNTILKITGSGKMFEILQVKYLNNILEQDHRFIKRVTRPMMASRRFTPPQPPSQESRLPT